MQTSRRRFLTAASSAVISATVAPAARAATPFRVATPMAAPDWALLQRELLRVTTQACEAYFERYFDERGYFLHFERWGANDGPDDTIENVNDWVQLHALGAPDRIKQLYTLAWEGHLRQFTAAKTSAVEIGRQGMFYKEFHVQNDWQHHSEELTMFNVQGLSAPDDLRFQARAKRFAGLYMGEDADAPNWDPKHKIIRSLINGSRGPMLRKATPLDWAGDPFDTRGFHLGHGEDSYDQFLAHYAEYTDVVGDHPLNLFATTLGLNAYMIGHERKYRDWLLGYVDAWAARARANGDILPSNIGLDGVTGSATGGNWWGGAYGWGFSPVNPSTGKREDRNRVPRTILGFFNAYLLTGDDRYLDTWRRQSDAINTKARTQGGKVQTPTMHGPQGWYGWKDGLNQANALDIWWFSMKESDRRRAPDHPWVAYLEGRNPAYPATALREALAQVQKRAEAQRQDTTTPDTRLADAVLDQNPAEVTAMLQTMMGALHIARPAWSPTSSNSGGSPLYARLRYFDADRRRAGVPEDVGALVDTMTASSTGVTLVNLNPVQARTVIVQGGGYGEHRIRAAVIDGVRQAVNDSHFEVRLEPGAGARIVLEMDRYVNQPTLSFPWDR